MDRANTRVGVLLGGLSAEHAISLKSGHAVAKALSERGWNVVEVEVGRDLPERLRAARVDVAWIALHGRFGEDGCVQGLLEVMGIPYTGSGVRASSVAMDKIATKRALQHRPEIRQAHDVVVARGETIPEVDLPVVVKPAIGGSTIGVTIVRTGEAFRDALTTAFGLDDRVLLEEFVEGTEITVAVVDGKALPVVAILPESGFFDFEAKYTKGRTRYVCPAEIAPEVSARAMRAAEAAFEELGCVGLARADFLIPTDGHPVFLEINTIPGMTETSLSPMAAAAVGVSFGELCERLLQGAHRMEAETAG